MPLFSDMFSKNIMPRMARMAALVWLWGGLFLHAPLRGMSQPDGAANSAAPRLNDIQVRFTRMLQPGSLACGL